MLSYDVLNRLPSCFESSFSCFRRFCARGIVHLARISLWLVEQAVESAIALVERTFASTIPVSCDDIIEQVAILRSRMMFYVYLSYGRSPL